MSIRKRNTPRGETAEYHYEFMHGGKRYYGVCENCTTERAALSYEKSIKQATKELAAKKNIRELVEFTKRNLTDGDVVTLADAFERYHAKPKPRKPCPDREKSNRSQWNDFVAFMSASYSDIVNLDQVERKHAENYIAELVKNGRFTKEIVFKVKGKDKEKKKDARYRAQSKLSKNTINAYHKQCKSVFDYLSRETGIFDNPFDFAFMKLDTQSRDAFTLEELKLIGDNLNDFVEPIFVIGICSGLSEGDICTLRWPEIQNGWIQRKRRKTGASLEIPILPPLARFLDKQRLVSGGNEYVLPEHAAMYQTNSSGISYRVKSFLEGLGIATTRTVDGRGRATSIKDVHSLRHTFAYMAGCYQIPLPVVQSVLGHMSPEMTRHYQAHADRQAKEKYLAQMPNFLESTDETKLITPATDPDREKLKQLADQLPLETVRKLLAQSVIKQ